MNLQPASNGAGNNPEPFPEHTEAPSLPWSQAALAGRLCECSGHGASAVLSTAFGLVVDAQFHAEPAAWVTSEQSTFHPTDAAAAGTDLNALCVIRLAPLRYTVDAVRAAELLTRSGAFGLVVLDLGSHPSLPMAAQARLAGLAKKHDTAILCLTDKNAEATSIGSMVSLRIDVRKRRCGDDRFECALEAVKDKRRGPGWSHVEIHRGPPGLH